jgi:hypothetical protein
MIDTSNPSFDLAKQQMIHGFGKLIKFSNNMHAKFPLYGFKQLAEKFEALKSIIQSASGPCFSTDQIDEIKKFCLHISSSPYVNNYFKHQGILHKLHEFMRLLQAVINSGNAENIILWRVTKKGESQNVLNEVKNSSERAFNITTITDAIVDAVPNREPVGILSIASILLTLIIRVEAHEYEIENMIDIVKKYVNPFDYDIEEMLSVTTKVQKGRDWKSDTRAIRDAISHASFAIHNKGGVYLIRFKNKEKGYNFVKTFTGTQLLLFYQDYTRLIVIQTLLLNSALLMEFLIKEFKKID